MSSNPERRSPASYDEARMDLELDAIERGITPGEALEIRARERGFHVVSTGEQSVGPVRRKLGSALIWMLTKGKKHD